MAFHELAHAVIESRAYHVGLADLPRGELQSLLDVPDDGVLHLVAVSREHRSVPGREVQRPQHLEDLPGLGEVRLAVLDVTAERVKGGALRVERRGHASVHRQASEVAAPGNAHALEVAPERGAEAVARLRDGDR